MKVHFPKLGLLTAAVLFLSTPGLPADNSPTLPPIPATDWRQASSRLLPVSSVGDFGGDPVIESEFGVRGLELRTYQLGKQQEQVVVESAADPTAAYGLWTYYQTPEMTAEKDIQLTAGDSSQTLMARGGNFLRFLRGKNSSLPDPDFDALLLFVGGSKPSESSLRSLPTPMPAQGLIPRSEKYLLGLEAARRVLPNFRTDLLGFEQSAEVQLGRYKTQEGTATLISISYPTPQIARVRFGALSSFLSLNQPKGDATIFGTRQGSYVFLVRDARNPDAANRLLRLFQVTDGLSWDQKYVSERTFTMQLVHMFLGIFLLIAILISACALVGVAFFLSRRLAARFFPNSQWGQSDSEQLIRLDIKYK